MTKKCTSTSWNAKKPEFSRRLKDYLDFVFEAYRSQNKNHIIVAIGCTGGQHRSVSVCNWLNEQYRKEYKTYCFHRDAVKEDEA